MREGQGLLWMSATGHSVYSALFIPILGQLLKDLRQLCEEIKKKTVTTEGRGDVYPPNTLFQQCIFNKRRGAISAPREACDTAGNARCGSQSQLPHTVPPLYPGERAATTHGVHSPGPLPGLISTTQKRTVSDVLLPLSANEYSNSMVVLKSHTEDWNHPHRRSSPLPSSPGDLLLSILIRDLLSVNSQDSKR